MKTESVCVKNEELNGYHELRFDSTPEQWTIEESGGGINFFPNSSQFISSPTLDNLRERGEGYVAIHGGRLVFRIQGYFMEYTE